MFWYTRGAHAALTKLAFDLAQAERILKLVEPHVIRTRNNLGKIEAGTAKLLRTSKTPLAHPIQSALGTVYLPPSKDVVKSFKVNIAPRFASPAEKRILAAIRQIKTPEDQRMAEGILAGHELDELHLGQRTGTTPDFQRIYNHADPRVILREHARVATLPAPYQNVRELYQAWRSQPIRKSTEADLLELATRGVNNRPGITYGAEGTRFSRHAQKHLAKRMDILTYLKDGLGEI